MQVVEGAEGLHIYGLLNEEACCIRDWHRAAVVPARLIEVRPKYWGLSDYLQAMHWSQDTMNSQEQKHHFCLALS